MSEAHSLCSVAGRHPINAVSAFANAAARTAHVYVAADINKIVTQTDTNPATYWLITDVVAGVATFTQVMTCATAIANAAAAQTTANTAVTNAATAQAAIDAWIPTEAEVLALSGLVGYYDANHVHLTAGKVDTWTDRSSAGNNATQATGAKQPTVNSAAMNGLDTLQFSGGQCLQTPSINITTFSIFTVMQTVTGSGKIVYEQSADSSANSGCSLGTSTAASYFVNRGGTKSGRNIITDWALGIEPFVMLHQYDGTHGKHIGWLRGNSQTPSATNGADSSNPAGAANAIFNFGSRNNAASLQFTGELAALAIFTPALSLKDALRVVRFFGAQYGCGNG